MNTLKLIWSVLTTDLNVVVLDNGIFIKEGYLSDQTLKQVSAELFKEVYLKTSQS